jgi:lysophospholipase L1-like esterase
MRRSSMKSGQLARVAMWLRALLLTLLMPTVVFLAACGGGGAGQTTATFSIGGTVAGLAMGETVTLANNVTDTLVITASGAFSFASPITENGSYAVTVVTQPPGQVCTVSGASGTQVLVNITTVGVSCVTENFTIGGVVSGLSSGQQVTLLNNGGSSLVVAADGAFQFATTTAYHSGYQVTVGTQPTHEMCSVTNGGNPSITANVSAIAVSCVIDRYPIAVTVGGLSSGQQLTLSNNGADSLTVTQNGQVFFQSFVPFGGSYAVTVSAQPNTQTCSLFRGSGTAVSTAITDLRVRCSPLVVNAWGDSLTAGAGTSNGPVDGYTGQLSAAEGYPVNNQGIGGQTSAQIGGRQGGVAVHMTLAGNQIGHVGGDTVTAIDNEFLSTQATTQTVSASGYLGAVHGVVTRSVVASTETYQFQADATVLQPLPASSVFVPDQQATYVQGNVIWAGRNDGGLPNGLADNLAGMVSKITGGKYIVMSVINAYNESIGTAGYNNTVTENASMAQAYGSHYLDIRSALVDAYDPSSAQDVIDHANDVIPQSLHAVGDAIHLNQAGYAVVAKVVAEKITALGW